MSGLQVLTIRMAVAAQDNSCSLGHGHQVRQPALAALLRVPAQIRLCSGKQQQQPFGLRAEIVAFSTCPQVQD